MNKHGGNIYEYHDILDFSANINPLGIPLKVREAMVESLEMAKHYPEPYSRQLVAKVSKQVGLQEDNVIAGNGAAELILAVTQVLKPQKALVMAPSFSEYEQALENVGCSIVSCYQSAKSGFAVEDSIIEDIDDRTDMVFLCNPNNPTGVLIDKSLMKRIIEKCIRTNTFLVIDESFMDLVCDGDSYSMLSELRDYMNVYTRLMILKSFTKTYAIPGIRLGMAYSLDTDTIDRMKGLLQVWNVSTVAQMAGVAALEEVEYVKQSRQIIKSERDWLYQELSKMDFDVIEGHANFLLFRGKAALVPKCVAQGILIRDCSNFEGLDENWYRVAVRNRSENEKLVMTLRKVIDL